MNALTKIRPGAFGLVVFGLMLSTVGTSIFKSTQQGTNSAANVPTGQIESAQVPTKPEQDSADQPEPDTALTYHQYSIDVEISNLDKLVRSAARDRLDAAVTADMVKSSLEEVTPPATPEDSARRLYLLRILRTLEDSEPLPTVEAVELPTVEGYRDVIGN